MVQMNQVAMDQVLQAARSATKSSKQEMNVKFPHVLFQLLQDETAPESIWWLPGNKEFAINSDLFPVQVLEVYMKGTKFASFIRRLHKMGFSRQTRTLKKVYGDRIPHHAIAFRNEFFQKDHPELLEELTKASNRAHSNKEAAKNKPIGAHLKQAKTDKKKNDKVPLAVSAYETSSATSSIVVDDAPAAVPSVGRAYASLEQQLQAEPSAADLLMSLGMATHKNEIVGAAAAATIPDALASNEGLSAADMQSYDTETLLLLQELQKRRQEELMLIEQERQFHAYVMAQQQVEQDLALRRRLLAAAMMQEQARQQQEQQHHLLLLQHQRLQQQQQQQQQGEREQEQPASSVQSGGESDAMQDALLRYQLLQRLQANQQQNSAFNASSGYF